MKSILLFIYLASILFSIVMAFIYRKSLRSRKLIFLLPFLIYVFIQEVVLALAYYFDYYTRNALVYNVYRPISVIIFFWIYYNIPLMMPMRKLITWVTAIYLVMVMISYCFIKSESFFSQGSYLILARGFVIAFYGILFLFRYFYLDNPTEEKYWRPVEWITIGIVIFYSVISISINFEKYLESDDATLYGLKLYNLIPQVMSIFMYSCFSYAFYLCKKIN